MGTKTAGRHTAFASNFMPLLDDDTEFAVKWSNLCDAHLEEGIHTPIIAFEYLNKFYVQEGNKRVSVLKYYEAVKIPGTVTRLIPAKNDTLEISSITSSLIFTSFPASTTSASPGWGLCKAAGAGLQGHGRGVDGG